MKNKNTARFALTVILFMLSSHHLFGMQDLNDMNINVQDAGGWTALHLAVGLNNIHLVRVLITAGANLNIQNTEDMTPLHLAVLFDQTNIVRALITAGADTHLVNNAGHNIRQITRSDETRRVIAASIAQRDERLRQEAVRREEVRRENERIRNAHRVEIVMGDNPQLPAELRNDILKFL